MASALTEETILEALKNITLDGKSVDLVAKGQISGVIIKEGNVGFSIEISPDEAEHAEALKTATEEAVMALEGVVSATAMLTAHRPQQQQAQAQASLHAPAKHSIAVASGKGGVGKSTTAINLALGLKALGQDVAILDADIYGPSLPRLLGINKKPTTSDNKIIPLEAYGLKAMSIGFLVDEETPTIWRGPMVMSAIEQMLRDVDWREPDILIIDMPPGTGDAQLTLAQRTRLSGAVIVSTPQDLALIDARKGLNMFRKVSVPVLGIVENMSYFICPSCGERADIFGHGGAASEAEKLGVPFLESVPLEMAIRVSSDAGEPIVVSDSEGVHAGIYKEIASKVLEGLEVESPTAPKITYD